MNSEKIVSCTPYDKKISIIIHLNYSCNFKCKYCIAGLETSNDYINLENIEKLFDIILKLYQNYKSSKIEIDINGGEPTLHKDFVKILKKFLTEKNIKIQVSTNGFLLYSMEKDLLSLGILSNNENFRFNISFHYFEYKNKLDYFVKSINSLLKYNINFNIKMFLPDDNETLANFFQIRDYIIEKTGIREDKYDYYLIMNFKGGISKTYNDEVLKFYNKQQTINDFEKNNDILLEYDNGNKESITFEELKSSGINNFKGFNCFYFSDKIALIYISPTGEVTLGSCILLDKKKFKLDEIFQMISLGDKSILCTEITCTSGLNLPKIRSNDYEKIKNLEIILLKNINKIVFDIKVEDIQISLNDRIIILFKIYDFNISLSIEKIDINSKYHFYRDSIGYNIRIKDNNNIIHTMEKLDNAIISLINNNILLLSNLGVLFKKII